MEFGERISPTAAIASILSAYPFSVGLLRELLQNSDDAKASKQVCASLNFPGTNNDASRLDICP